MAGSRRITHPGAFYPITWRAHERRAILWLHRGHHAVWRSCIRAQRKWPGQGCNDCKDRDRRQPPETGTHRRQGKARRKPLSETRRESYGPKIARTCRRESFAIARKSLNPIPVSHQHPSAAASTVAARGGTKKSFQSARAHFLKARPSSPSRCSETASISSGSSLL